MRCKFCDDFTDVCTNGECPMRGDCCPVPDVEGLCKFECREDDEAYVLTPLGCATAALMSVGLVQSTDDPVVDRFWAEFTELMKKSGYLAEEP